jgi:hypothetical protein
MMSWWTVHPEKSCVCALYLDLRHRVEVVGVLLVAGDLRDYPEEEAPLGEVDETPDGVGVSVLDEGQVGQMHGGADWLNTSL